MSGEPSSHARRALITSSSSSAGSKKETVNSRSGYGGISEKISRLNDILRSLEASRRYDSPDNSYSPIWPPTLYNSAKLLQTRAALESREAGAPDGVLNTLPAHTIFDRDYAGGGGVVDTPPHRGGGAFDSHRLHQRGTRGGMLGGAQQRDGVLETLARVEVGSSVLDTLTRDPLIMRRHRDTPTRHHARGVGGVLDTLSRQHASTPSHVDNYVPPLIRTSSSQISNTNHDYCHNYEPSQYGHDTSAPSDYHFKSQRAQSTELFLGNNEHTGGFLNVDEVAQDILGRLQRLEMQKVTSKKPKLQRTLSQKGSVRKGGGNPKISRQRKVDGFGERGLIQLVRRRANNGRFQQACEEQVSPRCRELHTSKNGVEEIENRVQRLESEMELCWSAINQLCIDNDQFREEQRRLTRRIGPTHQWGDTNGHAKLSYNLHKTKVEGKTKKRGGKHNYLDDSLVQANDSSG